MGQPNWNSMLAYLWPDAYEGGSDYLQIAAAANIVIGSNPPYSATDFLSLYPKFGGAPTTVTGTTDGTTAVVPVSSTVGFIPGQLVIGPGIADGAVISSVGSGTITLSANTTAAGTGVNIQVYTAMLIPLAVLNSYIFLATSSIFQARWQEMWFVAMGLFVAHYATLWLQGEASSPNTTAGQAASSGLALGIKTSKAVQDVSVGMQALDLEGWGTMQLTLYGQQLASWGAAIAGIQVIY